jgi:hypothetical protein
MKEISKLIFMMKIGKNGNFYIKNKFWLGHSLFFAVFAITFLEGPVFWPKKHPKTKMYSINKLNLTFYRFALED